MTYYIGVDVGGTTSTLAVGNDRNEIVYVSPQFATTPDLGPQSSIAAIVVAAQEAMAHLGAPLTEVAGAAIRSNWEFVVLQQGTSALPESQVDLIFWAERFDPVIRAAGAEPVMYQIWPLASQRYNADASLTSYYNAAAAIGAIHAPAGDAFTAALDSAPGIGVYHFDGLHASHRGTYLAALVILTRLGGAEPLTLPPTIPGFAEDTAIVRLLQRAATEALSRTEARPTTPR
jgi:hypothetical protein